MRGRVERWTHGREDALKMTLRMVFRFNRMNTMASKLEKNLCVCALVPSQQ